MIDWFFRLFQNLYPSRKYSRFVFDASEEVPETPSPRSYRASNEYLLNPPPRPARNPVSVLLEGNNSFSVTVAGS
ncbi:MAG: hypothetical protein WCI92_15125 [Bacteroidota bacterium]